MKNISDDELMMINGGDNATYGGVLAGAGATGLALAGGLAVATVAAPVFIGALAVVSIAAAVEGCWFAFMD